MIGTIRRTSTTEFWAPALAVMVLTVVCIASTFYLPFWFDELLTHYMVRDSSFVRMLRATGDLISASPPLYFILTWPIAQVVGAGELPLRLLSSLGISVAMLCHWRLLRRIYDVWPASLATVGAFFASQSIWYQNMEARFYGLFLAEVSLAIYLAVTIIARRPISRRLLVANALIHAALVTTHYFGFLYSGAILVATVLCLVRQPRVLSFCAGSIVVGWLAFLPCVPGFIRHLEFGKPHGWIMPPTVANLLDLMSGEWLWLTPALAGIFALGIAIRLFRPRGTSFKINAESTDCPIERRSLAVITLLLSTIPFVVWGWSQVATPMFVARYFIPDVFIACFVLAELTRFAMNSVAAIDRSDNCQAHGLMRCQKQLAWL